MRKTISIFCLFLALTACGGDTKTPTDTSPADTKDTTQATPSKSNDNTKVGVFIDAPVQGLAYTSAPSGKKGTTNEKGEFEYIDGDTVSFNMGSIELGSATPDKTNKVKVTQLDQALLIAQLLQVLDNDVGEDRIDVSDVVIPETVKKAIVDRLKDKDDEANSEDIITEEQLVSIKKANPKKMTLQRRVKVVSKEDVLKHVKQQIGKSGLRFTASELKNLFLIDVGLLKKFEGDNLAFSASNSIKQIIVEKNQAEMSDASWELDAKGNLAISFKRDNCTISKLNEDVDSIDISWLCADKEKPKNISKGLKYFVKPQPLSANDLSGKSFNFTSLSKESETLTFRNDGTLNCNGEKSSCPYKDHPSHKNAVWIEGGGDSGEKDALMILAQGTLAKGKFLMIHYKGENKLDSIEVIKVSGNTLRQVFETADNDESSDHSNNTDDNSDSNDNPNSGTQKPPYIPFTQEMLSDKTFYSLSKEDDDKEITIFFGANKKGQVWFSLSNSNTSPDITFDYLIDNEGYIIFSNTKEKGVFSGDTPAIGLLSETNNALTACWGSSSVSDISDFCKDDDIKIWYKTKEDAEAAIKERKDNDTDENTDDNSDSNDNPNAGTQNPNYIPFTQEMISGKTLYNVYIDRDDEDKDGSKTDWMASTFTFDNSGKGKAMRGLHDSASVGATFDYRINDKGYLILSNWAFTNPEDDPDDGHNSDAIGLITNTGDYFKVCWRGHPEQLKNNCGDDGVEFIYKTKEAAETKLTLENQ